MNEELDLNYNFAFANSLGIGERPALILIDFVQAYFDEACPLYADVEEALESALRIRNAARDENIPIFYTNVIYEKDGKNGGAFFKKVPVLSNFIIGSPMAEWPASLDVRPDEKIISKQFPSAFFRTSLLSNLTTLNIDTLIITGLTTSGCVRATCVDAISYGFRPIVIEDACGDRHHAPHEASLFDMNAKYGDVVSEKEVMHYFLT
jgi:maleamate amidohydrolase